MVGLSPPSTAPRSLTEATDGDAVGEARPLEKQTMFKRMALSACLLGSCAWCLAVVARVDSAEPAPLESTFHPVASLDSLMHGQEHEFKAIRKMLKHTEDKHRMKRIFRGAELVAEFANVNLRHKHKDKPDYVAWATTLRATALELAAEAKKRAGADEARMKSLFDKLHATCDACHDKYKD